MSKLELLIRVQDGRPQNYIFKRLAEELATFKNGKYWLKVTPVNVRTNPQNAFFHLLMEFFSKELIGYTGDKKYTPDLVKGMMKRKFLTVQVIDEDSGEIVGERVRDTSELNKGEMSDFWDSIIEYADEQFKIKLPYPQQFT